MVCTQPSQDTLSNATAFNSKRAYCEKDFFPHFTVRKEQLATFFFTLTLNFTAYNYKSVRENDEQRKDVVRHLIMSGDVEEIILVGNSWVR